MIRKTNSVKTTINTIQDNVKQVKHFSRMCFDISNAMCEDKKSCITTTYIISFFAGKK